MRPKGFAFAVGIGVGLIAASSAWAQEKPRPRVTVVVKTPAPAPTTAAAVKPTSVSLGQRGLRKPLGPAAAGSGGTPLEQSLAALVLAAAAPGGAPGPLKGLNPPSALAEAAQCRASCAQTRYVCTAQDTGDCETAWGQCVVRCSGADYRRAPDLVQRPAPPTSR